MMQMSSQDDNAQITAATPMTQQQPSHQHQQHVRHTQPGKTKKFFSKFSNKFSAGRKPASEKPRKSSGSASQRNAVYIDLDNRDPHELNAHLKTGFDEVIGEPEGAYSDPRVWSNVNKAFHAGRNCCFKCLTYACAIPLVFLWGCNFACITFAHIYSITPCFRVFAINCDCASKFFSTIIHCLCDPMYEAMGLIFSKIYVYTVQGSVGFQEKTYGGINMFTPRNKIHMVSVHTDDIIKRESIHLEEEQNLYVNTDDEHLADDPGPEKQEMYQHV